jgi:Type III secretion system lipoprotein chaperone (YscW)
MTSRVALPAVSEPRRITRQLDLSQQRTSGKQSCRSSPTHPTISSGRRHRVSAVPRAHRDSPGGVLTVAVEDVSRADAPATVLAKTAVQVDGQVPIRSRSPLMPPTSTIGRRCPYALGSARRSARGSATPTTPSSLGVLVTLSTSWDGACGTAEPSLIRRAMARWVVIAGLARPLKADIDGFKALVLLGFRITLVRTLVSFREGDLVGEWRKQSARI